MSDPITARVLFSVWSGDPAVVVPSPPGAGKTRLVALLAAALAHRGDLRVGIAAQTREQAVEIARRLGTLTDRAALMWKAKPPKPDSGQTPAVSGQKVRWPGEVGAILIGTTARWLFSDPDRVGADVLIVDESWQCTYADLGALGAMARQVVCVGDPGQIDPVVTGDVSRWDGSDTAPNLPGPIALQAAHGAAVGVVRLRHTWRLGADTTALIQPLFYPDLPFTSRRPPEHLTDAGGVLLPELAHRPVTVSGGPSDPALETACAQRARELAGVGLAEAPEDYDDQTTRALGHARYLATLEGIGVAEIAALERNALAREKFAFEQRKFDLLGRERRCQAVLTQAQALVAEVREQGRGERFQQLIDIALEEIEKMKRGEE